MHAVWDILLDDEFMQAYEHRIVITCRDGIVQRIYPRFFTYSTDYPEKFVHILDFISMSLMNIFRVLLATLKYLGKCPCPRCLIEKIHIFKMGTENDRTWRNTVCVDSQPRQRSVKQAHKLIFRRGRALNSDAIDKALGLRSEIPTHVSHFCGFLSSHVALTLV